MLISLVLSASIALTQQIPPASPTQTRTPPPATAMVTAEVATAQPSPVTRVCRTEAVTGSRFGRRVCRNSSEAADDRRNSQEMLRRMQGARMPDAG